VLTALLQSIETDLADLREHGRMRAAADLSFAAGQSFNTATLPQYFTGDFTAPVVLVHLYPKQADAADSVWTGPVPTLEQYLDAYQYFGRYKYGPDSPRTHRSRFDHKQIRFLRAFNVIDFVPVGDPDARYTNLQRCIDHKLQLELVPYGSDNFRLYGRAADALAGHFARLLDVIAEHERSHVLFCGGRVRATPRPACCGTPRVHAHEKGR
jgi:hypothetical protein